MKNKNEWLISFLQKFSNGQKTFDMILASQKVYFWSKGLGYKPFKNKKYFKNYFVKEASSFSPSNICNLYGRGGCLSDNCLLRKSLHVLQNSKLFWTNPLEPKKIWILKVT